MSLKKHLSYSFIIVALAISLAGCTTLSPQSSGPTATPTISPTAMPSVTAMPTVQAINSLPTGTQLVWNIKGGFGQLIISNHAGAEDAVIIMASVSDPKTALLAVYVKGGQNYTVYGITDGQYLLYDMLGTNWNNTANAFSNPSEYVKFNGTMVYYTTDTESKVYTVTINPPGVGGKQVQDIEPADMPALS